MQYNVELIIRFNEINADNYEIKHWKVNTVVLSALTDTFGEIKCISKSVYVLNKCT